MMTRETDKSPDTIEKAELELLEVSVVLTTRETLQDEGEELEA